MSKHLMLDLETLGHSSNAVITSIAAVPFLLEAGVICGNNYFHKNVKIQSCLDLGMHVDGSTIEWWFEQSEDARKSVLVDPINITQALYEFRVFLKKLGTEDLCIWGNSARFDLGILENAYKACKREIPWKYTLERDVRTLVSFAPNIKKNTEFLGIKHNPVDDCLHQINYCCQIWKKLNY